MPNIMPMAIPWQYHDNSMAITWQQHGNITAITSHVIAMILPCHAMCLPCFCHVDATLYDLPNGTLATMWKQLVDDTATTWPSHFLRTAHWAESNMLYPCVESGAACAQWLRGSTTCSRNPRSLRFSRGLLLCIEFRYEYPRAVRDIRSTHA